MKKFAVAIAAALALTLSACVDDGPQPVETVTPTPWPGDTAVPTPTSTPTPTQEELSAQAEQTYRAFFNEWKRLQFAGGADEPTQIMRDTATEDYVDAVMIPLRQQKVDGRVITGPMPRLTIKPSPGGDFQGIDPRLTLQVCEDHRDGQSVDRSGVVRPGDLLQGTIYFSLVNGQPKIAGGLTEPTETCTL